MNKERQKIKNWLRRKKRVRAKIVGTKEIPRLNVFRSIQGIRIQLIDDQKGHTLFSLNHKAVADAKGTKTEKSRLLGKKAGEEILKLGYSQVVFDRGGFLYHGRIQAFADGARESGLIF